MLYILKKIHGKKSKIEDFYFVAVNFFVRIQRQSFCKECKSLFQIRYSKI